jgi:leader peptidase (prepilin peptidase)/N-methyltransferase
MDADFSLQVLSLVPLAFVIALGCCVGSLINVLVYRMPLGLGVVTPPSECPKCQTKLTWRENVPVIGWILLGGRCRFCRSKISSEYPIVEVCVGALFGLVWVMCYLIPPGTTLAGLDLHQFTPDWARNGWIKTWPIYGVIVGMISCLLAMTIIDARTFIIPLQLAWACALIGLIGHVGGSLLVNAMGDTTLAITAGDEFGNKYFWAIATPAVQYAGGWWWWIGASIGAMAGLGVGLLMLRFGWIRRSFLDYDAWEKAELARQAEAVAAGNSTGQVPLRPDGTPEDPTQLWTAYPHARREMIKEMAFLAPAAILGGLGGWLFAMWFGSSGSGGGGLTADGMGVAIDGVSPPPWLLVLSGVLLGYLIGGGVVWLIRIFGTLAFGKEAMGLGDVHLMAAVGACLGWIDVTIAFFVSAFIAMGWTIISAVGGKGVRKTMPYGPWLALASVLVFLLKPLVEAGISRLVAGGQPINLP